MTSCSMISLRALPLLLILSLLVPSEARVGGTNHAVTEEQGDSRQLGGGYGRKPPHQSASNQNGHYPKHYGSYYIKRPVDPSEYYHHYKKPASEPTYYSNEPEPTKQPTNKPTESRYTMPEAPKETLPDDPTYNPTAPPVPQLSDVPTEPPVPASTDAPTNEVPPTFNPAVVVTIEVVKPNETETTPVIKPVDINIGGNETTTITFEPPTKIQARLAEFALEGGEEFEDPFSYQYAALKRVEAQVGADAFTDAKLIQYYALYCLYESTNGKTNDYIVQSRVFGEESDDIPGWTINAGWLENDLDPCEGEWYGISCVDDQVVNVDLFDNGLTGNFAPEIVLLAGDGFYSTGAGNLVSLDIFNNELMSNNGNNEWIADLGSQLGYLYLQNTGFMGKLPSRFPEGLVELDLANSMITGTLDGAAFENLSSLRFLLMDGVQFDSSIPSEIAALPNLEYLFATDAMITGDLSYMESMPMIFEHWVDRNPKLGGKIPSFVGSLTTLQSFSIADCGFTGTIPESLGNLGLMQQMWLYGNQLTGEIPASLGRLRFMRIFEVEGNQLSDGMPESICENFSTGMLQTLGADCDVLDCPCCTCCTVEECREQN